MIVISSLPIDRDREEGGQKADDRCLALDQRQVAGGHVHLQGERVQIAEVRLCGQSRGCGRRDER